LVFTEFLPHLFVAQFTVVCIVLLRAFVRAGQRRDQPGAPALATLPGDHPTSRPRTADDGRPATAPELVELEAERRRLLTDIEQARTTQAREEAEFRARRRAVMVALHRDRQAALELTAAEPALRERVDALRTEVEHLERRHPELTEEIRASIEASTVVRGRLEQARDELAMLHRDRARLCARLDEERARLRDLANRRALLEAETEALTSLARVHQEAVGEPRLLSLVTDGDFRDDPERPGPERSRTDQGELTPVSLRVVPPSIGRQRIAAPS